MSGMFLAQGSAAVMHAQVVGRVKVGALPVHGYNIPQLGQFWAHSDIDGTFFVIPVDNINGPAQPCISNMGNVLNI